MNLVRITLLVLVPSSLLALGGYAIAAEEGLLFGILLAVILTAGLFWFSDMIVVRICKAELLTIYHDPPLFRMVEALSREAGVPVPKIFSIDEAAMNALAIGTTERRGGIVFTDGIRRNLPQEELRNVVAHQLVHIKNRDTLLGTVAAAIAAVFGMAAASAKQSAASEAHDSSMLRNVGKFAFSGALIVLAPVAALFVQLLVDVKRKFRADEAGAQLTHDPLAMAHAIRTLEKKKHQTPLTVVPAAAHLFMVSPLTKGRIARLFLTHPSMEQRIARLEAMHRNTPPSNERSLVAAK